MLKSRYFQAICSGLLALLLLAGGIVSAAVISSQYSVRYVNGGTTTIDTNTSSSAASQEDSNPEISSTEAVVSDNAETNTVELIKGYIQPKKLSSGGYSITSGNYTFKIYKAGNVYKTAVTDKKGKIVAMQENAITIQIKKMSAPEDLLGTQSEIETINADYQKISVKDNTVLATATVKNEAGSVFAVTDQYIGSENSGFELSRDIKVQKSAEEDDGFNSIVSFKEEKAETYENYEYFIPAILYKNSDNLSNKSIGYNLAVPHTWVRDTHMGTPMVTVRNIKTGNCFTIGRITNKVYSGIDESTSGWLVNKNLDYSSVGFSNVKGYVSVDFCYPGIEGSINYFDLNASYAYRSHPVRKDVKHSYRISFYPDNADFNDAVIHAFENQIEKNTLPKVDADINKVYDQTLALLDEYTYETEKDRMSCAISKDLTGDVTAINRLMGFIGQETAVGFHLIRSGIKDSLPERRAKGEDIIDFWVSESFTEFGFPKVFYRTASGVWSEPQQIPSYMRYMADGMEGILNAYIEEKSNGVTKSAWLEKCVTFADWLSKTQNADGSFYRTFDFTTGEVYSIDDGKNGKSKSGTTIPVRFLVRMYEQTGKRAYLDSALKAGEYAYTEFYQKGKYYGGTADGENTIDREAAVLAMYAFNSLYEATEDKKWLACAEHAAVFFASNVYTFDFNVWGNQKYNIYRDLVGTSGLSIIHSGKSGIDVFAAYCYYEMFKLYVYTGNHFYYDFAVLLQNNTKQFVNIDGSLPYGKNGLINEATNIANQYYESSVDTCLTWCNIAMIEPISLMDNAFGVKTVEDAKALGTSALIKMLKEYGAGGKKR